MSDILNKIIKAHIDLRLKDSTDDEKGAVIKSLKEQIGAEIISEKADEFADLQNKIKKKIQEENNKTILENNIKSLNKGLIVAALVGICIGVLVNQITDLISLVKGVSPNMPVGLTFLVILIFLVATVVVFYSLYINGINDLIKNVAKKGTEGK